MQSSQSRAGSAEKSRECRQSRQSRANGQSKQNSAEQSRQTDRQNKQSGTVCGDFSMVYDDVTCRDKTNVPVLLDTSDVT